MRYAIEMGFLIKKKIKSQIPNSKFQKREIPKLKQQIPINEIDFSYNYLNNKLEMLRSSARQDYE